MDLQVVIVNWNSGKFLGRLVSCLEPLRREVRQILVVDNASTDGSVGALEGGSGIDLLAFDRNLGFAGAANRAARQSASDWILLLNPDIAAEPDTIRELYRRAERIPDIALACVALLDDNGSSQAAFQIRSLPTAASVLSDVLFLDEFFGAFRGSKGRPSAASASVQGRAEPVPVEQPAAAFWLVRRSAWDELGGFDEQFWPAWFEDVDFCRRLAGTHWRILLFPDLCASHTGGHSLRALPYKKFLDFYYGNMLRYLRKHHPGGYRFLWPAVRLGAGLRKLLQ